MTSDIYEAILSILRRKNYNIEGLHEVGLPMDFYEKTTISPEMFDEFYNMYIKKTSAPSEESEPEVVVGNSESASRRARTVTMFDESLLERIAATRWSPMTFYPSSANSVFTNNTTTTTTDISTSTLL